MNEWMRREARASHGVKVRDAKPGKRFERTNVANVFQDCKALILHDVRQQECFGIYFNQRGSLIWTSY